MEKPHDYKKSLILGASTVLGIGLFPLAPGTFASLIAVIVYIFVENYVIFLTITLFTLVISFLVAGKTSKIIGQMCGYR
jgi:hypothetical protein